MIMCVLLCYPVSIHMSQLLSTGRPISSYERGINLQRSFIHFNDAKSECGYILSAVTISQYFILCLHNSTLNYVLLTCSLDNYSKQLCCCCIN